MDKEAFVSICCVTYNHQEYIGQAIESFLMQKTTFPIEILIHDDASTDNTATIIKEYEKKYPKIIKPIYQKVNQFSQGFRISLTYQFPRARGKYIALCEGDDYWTDPYKLQKQVDFLEVNDEYSLCVGGYIKKNEKNGNTQVILKNSFGGGFTDKGFTFTLSEMKTDWITKTLTVLFRKSDLDKIDLTVYKYSRDTHLIYHLVKGRKAFYFKEIFGVFRMHQGGINSIQPEKDKRNKAYIYNKELYEHNGDDFTRFLFRRKVLSLLNYNLYHNYQENGVRRNFRLFIEAVKLTSKFKEVFQLFLVFVPGEVIYFFKKNLGYPLGEG